MPTASQRGMFDNYYVTTVDGPTDPDAIYFVLRLDTDRRARAAARAYASSIGDDNPLLAQEIVRTLATLESTAAPSPCQHNAPISTADAPHDNR